MQPVEKYHIWQTLRGPPLGMDSLTSAGYGILVAYLEKMYNDRSRRTSQDHGLFNILYNGDAASASLQPTAISNGTTDAHHLHSASTISHCQSELILVLETCDVLSAQAVGPNIIIEESLPPPNSSDLGITGNKVIIINESLSAENTINKIYKPSKPIFNNSARSQHMRSRNGIETNCGQIDSEQGVFCFDGSTSNVLQADQNIPSWINENIFYDDNTIDDVINEDQILYKFNKSKPINEPIEQNVSESKKSEPIDKLNFEHKISESKKFKPTNEPIEQKISEFKKPEPIDKLNFEKKISESKKSEPIDKLNFEHKISESKKPEPIDKLNFEKKISESKKSEPIDKLNFEHKISESKKSEPTDKLNFEHKISESKKYVPIDKLNFEHKISESKKSEPINKLNFEHKISESKKSEPTNKLNFEQKVFESKISKPTIDPIEQNVSESKKSKLKDVPNLEQKNTKNKDIINNARSEKGPFSDIVFNNGFIRYKNTSKLDTNFNPETEVNKNTNHENFYKNVKVYLPNEELPEIINKNIPFSVIPKIDPSKNKKYDIELQKNDPEKILVKPKIKKIQKKGYVLEVCHEKVPQPKRKQIKITDILKTGKNKIEHEQYCLQTKQDIEQVHNIERDESRTSCTKTNSGRKISLKTNLQRFKVKQKSYEESNKIKDLSENENKTTSNKFNIDENFPQNAKRKITDHYVERKNKKLNNTEENKNSDENISYKKHTITYQSRISNNFSIDKKLVKNLRPIQMINKTTHKKFKSPLQPILDIKNIEYKVILLDDIISINTLKENIAESTLKEIAITIMFREKFCQMNKPTDEVKKNMTCNPTGLLISINIVDEEKQYYFLPIKNEFWKNTDTPRSLIQTLLTSNSRKLCYFAQELFVFLIEHFNFKRNEIILKWNIFDLLIGAWLLDPDNTINNFQEAIERVNVSRTFDIESNDSYQKGCYFLNILCTATEALEKALKKNYLWDVFVNMEMELVSILSVMEVRGVRVNSSLLQSMSASLDAQLAQAEADAMREAGRPFSINSTVQLRTILYDELRLDERYKVRVKETATLGAKSTSYDVMRLLSKVHPLPGLVLKYRRLHKVKSTYLDGILQHVRNGYIYTLWEQASAATGRVASNSPNLQAVPKTPFMLYDGSPIDGNVSEIKCDILYLRAPYIPRDGYTLLSADFQHIELRVFAHLAQDQQLIVAFARADMTDIYVTLTEQWLGIPADQILPEDREKTKRVVYSVMYGAGAQKLMEFLDVSMEEAVNIVNSFTRKFPALRSYTKRVIDTCRNQGYLTSLSGRRRLFPQINNTNYGIRGHSERQAVNFTIQGSAADICKTAMILAERKISENENIDCHLLLQIHDELVWEVRKEHLYQARDIIREAMEDNELMREYLVNFTVPLPVNMFYGENWANMKSF